VKERVDDEFDLSHLHEVEERDVVKEPVVQPKAARGQNVQLVPGEVSRAQEAIEESE